jgi:aminopeptidase
MGDIRVEKLAELLVKYSTRVKKGDKVAVMGDGGATPLLREIYKQVLLAGGLPFLHYSPEGFEETFFTYASDEQLTYVDEYSKIVANTYDVRLHVAGTNNTKALSSIDPAKMVKRSASRRPLLETILERSARGEMRWVTTLFPTNAFAQDAEMSLEEYEDFVYGACLPDLDDPVGYWERFSKRQDEIIKWLRGKENVHVTAPGTDLTLSVKDRPFINCDGRLNMPDGEIFTGPVEDSINGTVYFSYPSVYDGREVSGIRLTFKDGKCVDATAEKNEAFLIQKLDTDEGSRYVGEFAIGTNESITKFTREILFDEKINGSFHMALGTGYPESGSTNRSAVHWDMVCDLTHGGEITVDGTTFYKNGKFQI